ncbi:MAG: hypothetical protein R3B82_17245 [Sandaracinaceae bacterium]
MRDLSAVVILLAPWLASCGASGPVVCGDSPDPVVVTGLNGVLDGSRLAVEIVQLIPATCEETDQRVWMLFEDPGAVVTLGPEPSGVLMRGGVEVTDETIFFRDRNVGVRLEYPDGVVGPELRLVWFSAGTDLAAVSCTAEPFACAVE